MRLALLLLIRLLLRRILVPRPHAADETPHRRAGGRALSRISRDGPADRAGRRGPPHVPVAEPTAAAQRASRPRRPDRRPSAARPTDGIRRGRATPAARSAPCSDT